MPVPYTFGTATAAIPLTQLDSNFATAITIGNTAVYLGNTTTSIGNLSLANVTITSVSTPITPAQGGTGLTSITANSVIIGNATGSVLLVSPGTAGNVLVSTGTTWTSNAAVGQVYPGAGIANSTGSAWGTSYSTTGSGTVVALATSPTFVTPILGTPTSATLTNATGLPLTTGVTGILPVANGGSGTATPSLVAGTNVTITGTWPNQTIASTAGGTGTVTTVSVVSANGFAGTVANATTTPAITLTTSITGVLKGNGTAISAATAGTDYVAPSGALGTPSSGTLSSCTVDGTDAVGFRNIPQNSQSASYTLVLADAGKHIFHPSGDANARTYTIPANSSVAYPIGTAITFINMTSQVVTIAITTDTMYLSSAGTTGSRSLAQYGSATAIKITSTNWLISGSGLT